MHIRQAARLLAGTALLSSLWAHAQTLEVTPGATVLAGDPVHLQVAGATPGARLTLRAERVMNGWSGPGRFQAEAVFVADAQGRIDPDVQAPVSGSYQGVDARGLFWSMRPVPPAAPQALAPGEVVLELLDGERRLARQLVTLLPKAADVTVSEPDAFPGARFALPGGKTRHPALIVLGGSEGGSAAARRLAPLLASHGFAVLGLPYYSPAGWGPQGPTPPELPALPASFADIELSRLEQARDWLARQPDVDASRIGLYGISKGAEFALAAASRMPWVKAVAAIVPSDVVWEGWGPAAPGADQRSSFAWRGKALPWAPYEGFMREFANATHGQPVVLRRPMEAGRAAHPERAAAARIEVEKIAAPVLLVGGGDDQMWDSAGMARAIAARRAAAGLATTALIYPEAGHGLADHGWNPTTTYKDSFFSLGGRPDVDARAQADAWPRLLAFLRESLH